MSTFMNNWLLRRAMSAPRGGGGDGIEIPTVFQRVEWLENTDQRLFIDTGIALNTLVNPRIVARFQMITAGDIDWFGTDAESGKNAIYWDVVNSGNGGEYIRWISQSKNGYTPDWDGGHLMSDLLFADFHTLDVGGVDPFNNPIPVKVDRETVGTITPSSYSSSQATSNTIRIFRSRDSGGLGVSRFARFQVYSNDTLVGDFIPCYRKSDGKPGLWDMVTWQFRTNAFAAAQTDFTVGPDVVQPATKYIVFEDRAVEAICVANWSSDGIGLTMQDAAAVTSKQFGRTFQGNTQIVSFDEFQYFTGITEMPSSAFYQCSNLSSIILPNTLTDFATYSLGYTNIHSIVMPASLTNMSESNVFLGNSTLTVIFSGDVHPVFKNTAFNTVVVTAYVPYSADHSILAAYQTALAGQQSCTVYELNPDGTIPS